MKFVPKTSSTQFTEPFVFGTLCHLPVSIGNVMLQVLNLHITVLNPRLSLNKYDSSIFFLNVNTILHQMHYLYLRTICG